MTLPEDELEQYEEQLQDVDEKTILIWQLAELTAIRQLLETPEPQSESETLYECDHCGETVPKEELGSHADSHNAPPGEYESLFSEI
jgi:formylmethanofuran dehydrogenase subunit E